MSRPTNISNSLSFVPTGYSDITFSSSYYQNPDNGLSGSDSTSYARFTMRNTSYEIYYDFSVSGIPNGATINSVSCSAKGYVSSSSRYPSLQLYSGTTAKGSATNVTSTSTTNVTNLNVGTWTVNELSNTRLKIKVVATGNNYYYYFYGATLTVNYSLSGTEYEVSISNTSSNVTTDPSTTQYVFQGNTQEIEFRGIADLNNITITDNNNDISSSLNHITTIPGSSLLHATSATNSGTISTSYPISNSIGKDTNNTSSYTRLTLSSSGVYLIYSFDVSSIPSNATISSVSCSTRAYVTNTSSSITVKKVQLYANTTAKGSSTTLPTSNSIVSLSNTGSWTRSELDNIKLRFDGTYTGSNTYYIRVYGIDLTINYTIEDDYYTYTISNISADHAIVIADASSGSESLHLKVNGQFVKCNKIYKKINNVWTEVSINTLTEQKIHIKK